MRTILSTPLACSLPSYPRDTSDRCPSPSGKFRHAWMGRVARVPTESDADTAGEARADAAASRPAADAPGDAAGTSRRTPDTAADGDPDAGSDPRPTPNGEADADVAAGSGAAGSAADGDGTEAVIVHDEPEPARP